MTRLIGIDPGSHKTGYGVIDVDGRHSHHVASGCISTPPRTPLPERLTIIFTELQALLEVYSPQEAAIEQVFVHRNVDSALKLGHARGAALCALGLAQLPVSEYAPRAVKQALVGTGAAEKTQVQFMVRLLLQLNQTPQADAADALAVAICHAHLRQAGILLEHA